MNKLMIFGDSILKGVTYNSDKGRYVISPDSYSEKLKADGIATENNCKMGATIDKIEDVLMRKLDTIDGETVVLLELGGNDSDFDWQSVSDSPYAEHAPKTDISVFEQKYRSIVRTVLEKGAKLIISNIIPIDAEKYMQWLSKGRNYQNVMSYIGDTSTLYRWQEYYNSIVERIAMENRLPLIDLRGKFLLSRQFKELYCVDGLHPTEEGHNIIGNEIYRFISKAM